MTAISVIAMKGKTLDDYRYLFPQATGIDHTVKKGATVKDTIRFIPKVVNHCRWMVKDFVKQELSGLPIYEACEKLWYFTKHLVKYEYDELRKEQIKSSRRLIADGKGDCDCKTSFVDTCLTVLGITGIVNRITAYDHAENFSHIYSLIPDGKGKFIIMDCVWKKFNSEKPYTKKEDHIMELQFLDGIGETDRPTDRKVDAQALFGKDEGLEELGKMLKKGKKGGLFHRTPEQKKKGKERRKKGFHVLNKLNLGIGLLRAGILASMKLNILKVPESLKWGYATKEYAASKGMDMSKFDKVRAVLNKIEKIFYTAGGEPKNLKKAILTGRGNRHHEVAGLDGMDEDTPLSFLLGAIYQDEFVKGMEGFTGFGNLGDPATGTALAAASTAMGTLAVLLKSIGNLFPKKNKGGDSSPGQDPPESNSGEEQPASQTEDGPLLMPKTPGSEKPGVEAETLDPENPPEEVSQEDSSENLPAVANEETEVTPSEETPNTPAENSETPPNAEENVSGLAPITKVGIAAFYEKNKAMINTTAVVAGVITVALLINHFNSKEEEKTPSYSQAAINGIKTKKPKKKKGGKRQNDSGEQSIIALM